MSLSLAQLDRSGGVLLAQACGDALGVPYEFGRAPGKDELAAMTGGGLGGYAPGEYSDDTQMAACIAQVSATGIDLSSEEGLDAVGARFVDWVGGNPPDVGNQTRSVLAAASRVSGSVSRALLKASRTYAASNPRSAGNGALMRTSVIGISSIADRTRTASSARLVAELTHGDPLAGDSCVLWSEAVRVAVLDQRLDLLSGIELLPVKRRDFWAGSITAAEQQRPATFNPNGFTVTALQAAWAAITWTPRPEQPADHLVDALHAAVRIGNDTDTVAAIAGGLLGAHWGRSAIPSEWDQLVHGWPGLRSADLVRLATLTAQGGAVES
ncbi:MAG: ADP-ribosylglycohydrolase family protein [Actinomycetota bacterium]|nr:ADP-ribosylglycohydrolase family protein [Actinomycetota bacterium]